MENATLNKTTLNWLYETAKWTRFLAILGFVFIGFMILAAVVMGPVLSFLNQDMAIAAANHNITSITIAAMYGVLAIIYFFPIYYLLQFSQGIIKAYKSDNEEKLNASFQFLKKHFTFIGIMLISVLVIYLLAFIVGTFVFASKLF